MGFLGSSFQAVAPTAAQSTQSQDNVNNAFNTLQAQGAQATNQNGFANQNDVFAQQQALAGQLQEQALGEGPNPAQAALAQNTQANVAQQAALMGGQRGVASNPALLARQAAMQGSGIQQQGVGQAATLQAQQTLGAQQALAAQQQNLQAVAGNQISNQLGVGQALNNAALQGQQNQFGLQSNANSTNGAVQAANTKITSDAIGGLINGAGKAFAGPAAVAMAHGGEVPDNEQAEIQPASLADYFLSSGGAVHGETLAHSMRTVPGQPTVPGDSPKNDTVDAKLSPGEGIIPVSHMSSPEKAAAFARAMVLKNKGGK